MTDYRPSRLENVVFAICGVSVLVLLGVCISVILDVMKAA